MPPTADTSLSIHIRTPCYCLDTFARTTGFDMFCTHETNVVPLMQYIPHYAKIILSFIRFLYQLDPELRVTGLAGADPSSLCKDYAAKDMSWLLASQCSSCSGSCRCLGSLFSWVEHPVKCFLLDWLFYCESVNASPNGKQRARQSSRE